MAPEFRARVDRHGALHLVIPGAGGRIKDVAPTGRAGPGLPLMFRCSIDDAEAGQIV